MTQKFQKSFCGAQSAIHHGWDNSDLSASGAQHGTPLSIFIKFSDIQDNTQSG